MPQDVNDAFMYVKIFVYSFYSADYLLVGRLEIVYISVLFAVDPIWDYDIKAIITNPYTNHAFINIAIKSIIILTPFKIFLIS